MDNMKISFIPGRACTAPVVVEMEFIIRRVNRKVAQPPEFDFYEVECIFNQRKESGAPDGNLTYLVKPIFHQKRSGSQLEISTLMVPR